jgi:hypothetical protein
MTREVRTPHTGGQRRRDHSRRLSILSLLILLLALVGAMVAAGSKTPVTWMLAWPAPLILIFTAARFVREGYHKRDGVLVLGRPGPSFVVGPLDLSDKDNAEDELSGNADPRIAVIGSLSVPGPGGCIELARAIDPKSRRSGEERKRFEKPWRGRKRSLART